MPASTTLLHRLLTAGAALSLIAAIGVNASVARAITAPTITVIDINPSDDSYALDDDDHDNIAFNGGLLFKADDGTHDEELYKSDGTVAGTVLVKDINPSGTSNLDNLFVIGTTAYFQATDGTNGYELWKSDGTEAGTVMVKNINPSGDSYPDRLAAIGSTLYFEADDGTNGTELWNSDGTEAGTVMVKNINPSGNSSPGDLTAVGSTLYFDADDGTNGHELWKSDGTSAGTVMVKDVNTNASAGSNPEYLRRHGDLFYFFANDGVNGDELYLSDGTEAGTMRIPAPTGTGYVNCDCYDNPIRSTAAGVFFTYEDPTVGHELGFVSDLLPETNTSGNGLALALLALSGALAAGAVIARRKELRAN